MGTTRKEFLLVLLLLCIAYLMIILAPTKYKVQEPKIPCPIQPSVPCPALPVVAALDESSSSVSAVPSSRSVIGQANSARGVKLNPSGTHKAGITGVLVVLSPEDAEDAKAAVESWTKNFPASRIIVGSGSGIGLCTKLHLLPRTDCRELSSGVILGEAWNQLMKAVEVEKFVLLSPESRFRATNLSLLDSTMEKSGASFIGGSLYDHSKDRISVNCYQTRLKQWALRQRAGYKAVLTGACGLCDALHLPFLGQTEAFLRLSGFDSSLPLGVLTDFFLRAKHASTWNTAQNFIVATCPSVEFQLQHNPEHVHVKGLSKEQRTELVSALIPVAKKYMFDLIQRSTGERIWLCRRDYTLGVLHAWYHSQRMLQPFCLYQATVITTRYVDAHLAEEGHKMILYVGVALGSLKAAAYLPWEMDVDVKVEGMKTKYTAAEWSQFSSHFKSLGFEVSPSATGINLGAKATTLWVSLVGAPRTETMKVQLNGGFYNIERTALSDWVNKRYPNFLVHQQHSSFGSNPYVCPPNVTSSELWGAVKKTYDSRLVASCLQSVPVGSMLNIFESTLWDEVSFEPEFTSGGGFFPNHHEIEMILEDMLPAETIAKLSSIRTPGGG